MSAIIHLFRTPFKKKLNAACVISFAPSWAGHFTFEYFDINEPVSEYVKRYIEEIIADGIVQEMMREEVHG